MLIRRLVPSDAQAYQSLRLAALLESPSAFGASHEEERDTAIATIEAHLAPDSGRNRFGVFDGDQLIGVAGIGREASPKVRHKGFIRGMYVAPSHRSRGAGRRLLEQTLAFAASMPGLRQVTLDVTAGNAPALALYRAFGFTEFGREPGALFVDGVYHDTIHMVRLLA